jgi:hypothetical protein
LAYIDILHDLHKHRGELVHESSRIGDLIITIDKTVLLMEGKRDMTDDDFFKGFNEEKQKEHEAEARKRYGDQEVDESNRRWKGYSQEKQEAIKDEGETIFRRILENMDKGHNSPEVQAEIAAFHNHIGYFYDCSYDRLRGLSHLYVEDPQFKATFESLHPDMPEFLFKAIGYYCDTQSRSS